MKYKGKTYTIDKLKIKNMWKKKKKFKHTTQSLALDYNDVQTNIHKKLGKTEKY